VNIYQQNIIDHYKNPRNKGSIDNADYVVYEVNTLCGDGLKFFIKLDENKEKIIDIKFEGEGCAISQATASMVTEEVLGMTLNEMRSTLTSEYVQELIGIELNPSRLRCALLSMECLKKIR
jgi:nitrogen fixation protein NifU and related proteins